MFCVDLEVIKALTLYKCQGNIGQIRGDIRCLCASAYLDYYCQDPKAEQVVIELTHLPDSVERGLCEVSFSGNALFRRYVFYQNPFTIVDAAKGDYESLVCQIADV